jgi:hypothetical protein
MVLALVLLGCESPTMMMRMERSPDYEAGFADGCANAAAQGPGALKEPRRNEMLYANNADYRQGWNSGNVQCRVQLPNRL